MLKISKITSLAISTFLNIYRPESSYENVNIDISDHFKNDSTFEKIVSFVIKVDQRVGNPMNYPSDKYNLTLMSNTIILPHVLLTNYTKMTNISLSNFKFYFLDVHFLH